MSETAIKPVNRSMCGRFTIRGANAQQSMYRRVNCKCWDCRRCGPRKAGRYKHVIRQEAERLALRRFLTLTLDPKKLPEGANPVAHLRESFNKFRTYLRRKFGDKIQYIAVLEFQENGMPHLHCLIDRYIEQSWVKHAWSSLGGGEHVDVRLVDIHRVSRYLAKYLTKDLLMSAPKRSRRVTVSRGISLNPKREKTHVWEMFRTTIDELYRRFMHRAENVVTEETDAEGGVVIQSFTIEYAV